jgi:hypothetical protein
MRGIVTIQHRNTAHDEATACRESVPESHGALQDGYAYEKRNGGSHGGPGPGKRSA